MASLWTGLYPSRSGVLRSDHAVSEEALMPAEIFQDGGLPDRGNLAQRLDRGELRLLPGLHELHPAPPDASAPQSPRAAEPLPGRLGLGPDPLRPCLPADTPRSTLVPVSALDGRAPVRFLRRRGDLRNQLPRHLRQLHPVDRRADRSPARRARSAGPARPHPGRVRVGSRAKPSASTTARDTPATSTAR